MKKLSFLLLVFALPFFIDAQSIQRVEPPNWWIGMQNTELQLLVYGENISALKPALDFADVKLKQVTSTENPNYLFLILSIQSTAKPGSLTITFSKGKKVKLTYNYPLYQRALNAAQKKGFDASDVMYLVTPDRFANGDPNNDNIDGMKEMANRDFKGGRHGGDIAGLDQNLDYLVDMGFTAVWLNPVLENDQPEYSYHGYACTDYYKVDQRFGSNKDYISFAQKAKSKGVGLIMDIIVNHCGSEHWWMKDLPSGDWLNNQVKAYDDAAPKYTSHNKYVIQDPYVSQNDHEAFVDGWFVSTMPDLNQRNEILAKYLIQNSIWWIETADLAGIRMDTYPYPDKDFMTDWTCEIMAEYPNFNIVGEEWNGNPAIVAHWQGGKQNANGYTSCLPSLMDFPMQENLVKSLNAPEGGWNSGWQSLYETLALDFLYASPNDLVIFPDNHDMRRIYSSVNEDFDLFKMALIHTLTMRGTPQLYYGTEILVSGPEDGDHGLVRSDFPGGWEGDKVNGFSGEGLSKQEKEGKAFVKTLLNWRKDASVIHTGKLMHFQPKDGVYVYFRYNDSGEKVMIILNKNEEAYDLDLSRFAEMLDGVESGRDALSGATIQLDKSLHLDQRGGKIIELK